MIVNDYCRGLMTHGMTTCIGNTRDKKTLKRINKLINDVKRSPFEGIGKPEPLKENLSGFWSRRIDDTNRLVYIVDEQAITIISCRYHY
tara:strand:- start:876 stop:1142 length:267 start_codon:yes stop_codon:yes gene_type:complete